MSRTALRSVALVAAMAGALTLSACSDDSDSPTANNTGSPSASVAAPTTAAPSVAAPTDAPSTAAPTEAPTTDAPATSEAAPSTSAGGGDAAGKPSKQSVIDGLEKYYGTQTVPGVNKAKLAECIGGESYDTLSTQSLNAMKDGDPSKMNPADTNEFGKISAKCATAPGVISAG